jgi:hypothetical protein
LNKEEFLQLYKDLTTRPEVYFLMARLELGLGFFSWLGTEHGDTYYVVQGGKDDDRLLLQDFALLLVVVIST